MSFCAKFVLDLFLQDSFDFPFLVIYLRFTLFLSELDSTHSEIKTAAKIKPIVSEDST